MSPGVGERHGFAAQNPLKIGVASPIYWAICFGCPPGFVQSKSVSPGLLRKLFRRVTFAWRGKSHQNRADRTRILRRNYNGIALTEILHSPSLMLGPV